MDRVIQSHRTAENLLNIEVETAKGSDPREHIFNLCKDNGSVLLELKREETSLEDIFRKLTGKEE